VSPEPWDGEKPWKSHQTPAPKTCTLEGKRGPGELKNERNATEKVSAYSEYEGKESDLLVEEEEADLLNYKSTPGPPGRQEKRTMILKQRILRKQEE